MQTFDQFQLQSEIQKAIAETGYTVPTPIQQQAIPYLLEGKDLLGCAQTGTGKTAAFALPLLQNLLNNPRRANPKQTRILILTPTRELAIQIHESFKTYGKYLRFKYAVVFGGVGQSPQVQAMSQGVDVLVATPGRLMDLIQQRHLRLNELEVFVLDEADRMLDMGFINDIRKIIKLLPQQRHNLFFSATMPKDILQLSQTLLSNPVKIEVTPVSSTVDKISQSILYVDKSRKRDLLRHVLQDKTLNKVIVFTRTKHGANRVVEVLVKNNISSAAIHGNKSQSARQRALEDFRHGHVRVLVATDIAARGIDIDDISHVINFELPNVSESYVHRIGRTARAGASGKAISFCDQEEKAYVKDIEKLIGKPIPVDPNHPYHSHEVESARAMSKGKAKAQIEAREDDRGPRRTQRPSQRPGQRPSQNRNQRSDSRAPQRRSQSRNERERPSNNRDERERPTNNRDQSGNRDGGPSMDRGDSQRTDQRNDRPNDLRSNEGSSRAYSPRPSNSERDTRSNSNRQAPQFSSQRETPRGTAPASSTPRPPKTSEAKEDAKPRRSFWRR